MGLGINPVVDLVPLRQVMTHALTSLRYLLHVPYISVYIIYIYNIIYNNHNNHILFQLHATGCLYYVATGPMHC